MAPRSENTPPPITPTEFLRILWRRIWMIILVAAVATGSALGFTLQQTPMYKASVKILIGRESTVQTPLSLNGEVQGLQELTKTMAKAVPTVDVTQKVVEELDLPAGSAENLRNNLSAEQAAGTMFVDVTYRDSNPEKAQLIANTVGQVFSEQVSEMRVGSNSIINATVWQSATLPGTPVSPDPLRNGMLGLGLGILLGIGLAFLLDSRDDRWYSLEELERVSSVPTVGIIPKFEAVVSKKKGKH